MAPRRYYVPTGRWRARATRYAFMTAIDTLASAGTLRSSVPAILDRLEQSFIAGTPHAAWVLQGLLHRVEPHPAMTDRITAMTLASLGPPPPPQAAAAEAEGEVDEEEGAHTKRSAPEPAVPHSHSRRRVWVL